MLIDYIMKQKKLLESKISSTTIEAVEVLDLNKVKLQEETPPQNNEEFIEELQEQKEENNINTEPSTSGLKYFEEKVRKSLLDKLTENGIKREIERSSREKIYWSITELNECLLKTLYKQISSEENKTKLIVKNGNPLLSLHGVSGDSIHRLIQENLKEVFGDKLHAEYTVIEENYKIKGRLDILIKDEEYLIIELKSSFKPISTPYLSHQNQCKIQMFCIREAEKVNVEYAVLWYLPTDKYFVVEYDDYYINNLKPKILKLTELFQKFKEFKESLPNGRATIQKANGRNVDEEFILLYKNELRFIKNEHFCKFCEYKDFCLKYNIIR